MHRDAFVGLHQFFQGGMAKQHQLRLRPIGTVRHKQSLPIFGLQGLPQGGRGHQHGRVFIEQGERNGLPKHMEWYAGLGILVTLVWLYLELLRLFANLRERN